MVKEIVKIGFDEEKEPLPKSKLSKIIKHKAKESEISKEELSELPKLPSPQEIVELSAEGREKEGMSSSAIKLEDLEAEIKAKKKLLKQKKKEEAERMLILAEEQTKALELAEKTELEKKEKLQAEEEKKGEQDFLIVPENDLLYKLCPLCKTKISKSYIKKMGTILIQNLKCKNKSCTYQKEIKIEL